MAIYTPRGLEIRIGTPYAFELMARLHPEVRPFHILKTTEGIESVPGMLAFITGIIMFVMRVPPLHIALAVGGAQLAGVLINLFGFYIVPGLVPLGTFFSYAAGFGVFLTVTCVVGFLFAGWQAVLAFFLGKLGAEILSQGLGVWQTRRCLRLVGHPFTASEFHFFNAYRLHASRIGAITDIDLKDDELDDHSWGPTFQDFAREWPKVVSRVTAD